MFTNILLYLLVGTLVGFCLEAVIRWTGNELNGGERIVVITLWPLMGVMFIINFIKGFFE